MTFTANTSRSGINRHAGMDLGAPSWGWSPSKKSARLACTIFPLPQQTKKRTIFPLLQKKRALVYNI